MNCPHCERPNREHRQFCGACGARLVVTCAGCDFTNDASDRFCGGCGTAIRASAAPRLSSDAAGAGVTMLSPAELEELIAEVRAVPSAAPSLPQGPIGQDDLDRLFGGVE